MFARFSLFLLPNITGCERVERWEMEEVGNVGQRNRLLSGLSLLCEKAFIFACCIISNAIDHKCGEIIVNKGRRL